MILFRMLMEVFEEFVREVRMEVVDLFIKVS